MAPTIRLAGEADLDTILALLAQLNPGDPPPDPATAAATWQRILAQPGLSTLVACLGETVVACLTLVTVPNLSRDAKPYALIENVVTDAAHRGQRIGRTLMDAAIRHAWD
jgi:GNAT superfamily N-acetyltransferase